MRAIDHASEPHGAADENHFVLPALMQPLLGRTHGLPVRVYRVTFGEGARTNWHKHDDVQVLYGLSGTCVVVDRVGNSLRLHQGRRCNGRWRNSTTKLAAHITRIVTHRFGDSGSLFH